MSDYHHTEKYGKTSQGRPVRVRRPGSCHLCGKDYPPGELLIYLPGSQFAVHPDCVYTPIEIRHVNL